MTYTGNPTRDVAAIFDPVLDAAKRELAALAAEREAIARQNARELRALIARADAMAEAL